MESKTETPGQVAYAAYCEAQGYKSYIGDRLPFYEDVKPAYKAAWEKAALTVLEKSAELGSKLNEALIAFRKHGPGKMPKIICMCGSSRFCCEAAILAWEFEKGGVMAIGMHLLPDSYNPKQVGSEHLGESHHYAEQEGVAAILDELHLRKIDLADELFVVNVGGYIGERTRKEIEYAECLGKPVEYLEPESPMGASGLQERPLYRYVCKCCGAVYTGIEPCSWERWHACPECLALGRQEEPKP